MGYIANFLTQAFQIDCSSIIFMVISYCIYFVVIIKLFSYLFILSLKFDIKYLVFQASLLILMILCHLNMWKILCI